MQTIQALGVSQVGDNLTGLWCTLLRGSPESLGWWNALEAYARINEDRAFVHLSKIIMPLAQGTLSERTIRDVSLCMLKPEFYKPILAALEKFGPRYSASFLDQMEDQARGYDGEDNPLSFAQRGQLHRVVLAMRAGLPVW